MNKLNIRNRAAAAAMAALTLSLAACGGGGGGGTSTASTGGGTSSTSSTPTSSSTPNNGTLATPRYATSSQELVAFNQLNAMRQQCGFPQLNENTLLDQSVANHIQYMISNSYVGHYETSGNPGFTGATPQARANYVGYTGTVGEVLGSNQTGFGGSSAIYGLSVAPYHLSAMFEPFSDIGMKYAKLTSSADVYVADLGAYTAANYQNAPLTYPCQGVANAPYANTVGEQPTPTINGTPITFPIGTPITVMGNVSDTLRLTSGTISDPHGNITNLTLMDSSNDSNHELSNFAGVAWPASPLQPNTTYNVSINGTDNGTAFSRNFSFTTGSQSY